MSVTLIGSVVSRTPEHNQPPLWARDLTGETVNSTSGVVRTLSTATRRALLLAGLALSLLFAFAGSAKAAGSAVNIGELASGGAPAIAVDASGNAQIASAGGNTLPYTIHTCTLAVSATACTHTHVITLAGGAQSTDGVKLLVDGGTIVLLADVYGASGDEYIPEQEWTSTNGGETFSAINGGKSVAEGILNADTGPLNAVIVPGTNILGYAWVTAAGPPTFAAFPLTSGTTSPRKHARARSRHSSLKAANHPEPLARRVRCPVGHRTRRAGRV